MPLRVEDLQHGDRVMLKCPKGAVTHRQATFEGIFSSVPEAGRRDPDGRDAYMLTSPTAEFLESSRRWARFHMQTRSVGMGVAEVVGAFAIDSDGTMRDDTGKRIIIERRLGRVREG